MYLGGIYRRLYDKPYLILLTQPACDELSGIVKQMPIIVPREWAAKWVSTRVRMRPLLPHLDTRVVCKPLEEEEESK